MSRPAPSGLTIVGRDPADLATAVITRADGNPPKVAAAHVCDRAGMGSAGVGAAPRPAVGVKDHDTGETAGLLEPTGAAL